MTLADRELLVIVENGASEQEWHDGRDEGVTASEIHAIASGSMKTRRRILDAKLNGSTFKGNAHTARGHEREQAILELPVTTVEWGGSKLPAGGAFAQRLFS